MNYGPYITEKWIGVVKHRSKTSDVFKNPTAKELQDVRTIYYAGSWAVRGFVDKKDNLYLYSAEFEEHDKMAKQLGFKFEDVVPITIQIDGSNATIDLTAYYSIWLDKLKREQVINNGVEGYKYVLDKTENNSQIKRLFRGAKLHSFYKNYIQDNY